MSSHARPLLVLAALLVALALGLEWSPAAEAASTARRDVLQPVPHSKVGRVEGTRAYIATSFDGTTLRVYVCDGEVGRPATISKWLVGRWDGRSPVRLVRDGIEVRIDRVHDDGRISGTLRAFSGPHAFTVEPARGAAGLYDGIDRRHEVRVTWIVLGDRSIRGAMAPTRPPRRVCRVHTVVLADGTTAQRVLCYDV